MEHLLERGYSVNVFDIKKSFENEKVHFFTGDLCNKEVSESVSYEETNHSNHLDK